LVEARFDDDVLAPAGARWRASGPLSPSLVAIDTATTSQPGRAPRSGGQLVSITPTIVTTRRAERAVTWWWRFVHMSRDARVDG
jgi:hypothetical protein